MLVGFDGDGADGREANQEIRPFYFSVQSIWESGRCLVDVDVGKAATVEPSAEPVLGGLALGAAFDLGEHHPGVRAISEEFVLLA